MNVFNNLFDYMKHVRQRPVDMLGAVSYTRLYCFFGGFRYGLFVYKDLIESDEARSVHLFTTMYDDFLTSRLGGTVAEKWDTTAQLVACVQPGILEPCYSIIDPGLDERVFYKYFEIYDEFLKHNENNDHPRRRNRPEWYI